MSLLDVVLSIGVVVTVLHGVALATIVGRSRLARARCTVRSNLETVGPTIAVLVGVLALNGLVRNVGVELSWLIGVNVTGAIFALEGQFVAQLQSLATPRLTAFFSFMYVYGYVFLLTFPVLAYLLQSEERPLRVLVLAYVVNYTVGLVCYIAFVSYGPRNFMPELVESLLYTAWPESQLLTSRVNKNTNVFPSLHTSLSVTVALVAARFQDVYRRWVPVAAFAALSISVSTMYLGIHWLTDVVGGVGLAVLSLAAATWLAETDWQFRDILGRERRLRDWLDRD